jgi:hypothetical protein
MATPRDIAERIGDADLTSAARKVLRQAAVKIGASATTKFMRTGGTGVSLGNPQSGAGTLRRQSGTLARSLIGARSAGAASALRGGPDSVFDLSPTSKGIQLTYGSRVDYAAVHEYGFSGPVQVGAHRRTMTTGFGPESAYPMDVTVRAHTRQMDIPARPYLQPALVDTVGDIQEITQDTIIDALFGPDDDG